MNTNKSRVRKETVGYFLIGLFILSFIGMAEAKAFGVRGYDTTYQSSLVDQGNTALIAMGSGSPGLLKGTVTFVGVPCGPSMPSRVPPCNGPYPNYEIVVYRADGVTIETRTSSDKNGNYKISLIPGSYIIYTPIGPVMKKTNTLTIVSGKTMRLDLVIDAGIRSDAPPVSSLLNIDTRPFNSDSNIDESVKSQKMTFYKQHYPINHAKVLSSFHCKNCYLM